MSAYYALRLYQRTMHNRKPEAITSREIGWRDGVVLAPLVLCILGLALYPQLILSRTNVSANRAVASTCSTGYSSLRAVEKGMQEGEPTCISPSLARQIVTPASNGWTAYAPLPNEPSNFLTIKAP